jgi:hypothetical protein
MNFDKPRMQKYGDAETSNKKEIIFYAQIKEP